MRHTFCLQTTYGWVVATLTSIWLTQSLYFLIFAKRLTQSFIQSSKPQFIAPYFLISATNSNMAVRHFETRSFNHKLFVATLVLVPTKPFLYVIFFFFFFFNMGIWNFVPINHRLMQYHNPYAPYNCQTQWSRWLHPITKLFQSSNQHRTNTN